MSLLVSWFVFPAVLGALSLGCGLLLERVSGRQVPGALLLPLGFAAIVVAAALTTTNGATAQLTTPLVVGLSVAGLVLALPWRTRRLDGWAFASAVGVYGAFGAPVLLSGRATFAGYITLDDTSTWLGFTDRLLQHGRTLTGLGPSTYEATLDWYWNQNGYPVGAFPPLGVGHALVGTDSAWLIQPYISFAAALLALSLYALLGGLIESSRLRALVAFVAAQPALLYAYALWGGVKEVLTAAILALLASLTPLALRGRTSARSLLPLATASAAMVAILNLGSAVWLAPLLVPALVVGIRVRGRAFARVAIAFAALAAALSVPALISAGSFLKGTSAILTTETELGNLIHPLSWLQLFGIWPVGDFRLRPGNIGLTYVLVGVVIAAAAAGFVWALRRRMWELPLYVGAAAVGCLAVVGVASPWTDAKALAIASPAIVLAAISGAAWLFRGGRRIEATLLGAAIAGGVLGSNALTYHDVWLAPRGQLRELEAIGKRFTGEGPTLMTEYQPYGTRHFLRNMAPESTSELRRRTVPLRSGKALAKGEYADIDRFRLSGILVYRTLVLPHSPAASRPPSVYRLVWSGRSYDVWQRPEPAPSSILEHLSLGSDSQAAARPRCGHVLRLARLAAGNGGRLATVLGQPTSVLELSRASYPPTWQSYAGSPAVVYPSRSGTLTVGVRAPGAGRYGIWLGGSFRRRLEVSIDGRRVGVARHRLNHLGVYTLFGEVTLEAGAHQVMLRYSSANLSPGSGGAAFPLGPLVLSRYTAELPVTYVQPADAGSLCGKSLDWVEALRG